MPSYEYARPALTTDCVVFGLDEEDLKVLLIKRGLTPFKGKWALPGGFVREGEDLEKSARRELQEETGLKDIFLEQLYTFGHPKRDPREHVVTVAYYALVNLSEHPPTADTDADEAAWFPFDDLPKLAFDHSEILASARERLRSKLRYSPIGFELLPEKFTLTQLQSLYERILDEQLDKRNFRKKLLKLEILEETDEIEQDVAHRAARLYRFDRKAYLEKQEAGLNLEI
ncbi:NUDIX hydrolase [Roseibacillus persicicus]|uniref:NUDIX hydrolase n=1 Tax=Roseibacillus persicicus TaxID=454148 RepID=A0A918WI37_9BACT|nr:NUDIX domain-containing protein [Roseibacillus persicicus]MDQ8190376.1 NUDIX domain-containing protein [Roseibacillus persicicus]GHC48469.1 NUDIX hydrolase [Roseibacillus persicicus]